MKNINLKLKANIIINIRGNYSGVSLTSDENKKLENEIENFLKELIEDQKILLEEKDEFSLTKLHIFNKEITANVEIESSDIYFDCSPLEINPTVIKPSAISFESTSRQHKLVISAKVIIYDVF